MFCITKHACIIDRVTESKPQTSNRYTQGGYSIFKLTTLVDNDEFTLTGIDLQYRSIVEGT